jgi:hypothetical protein
MPDEYDFYINSEPPKNDGKPQRWAPQTCACIVDIDATGKHLKTINKCDLHKEYTGRTLVEEIRKHNKENSPQGEPDTMEIAEIAADFEPNWVKEVIRLPSVEKLEETGFNLLLMEKYPAVSKEFQYCLSNFLNSSTSVLWYLLDEYNKKFGFEIGTYRKDEKYKNKVEPTLSSEAKNFLAWYDTAFTKMKNGNTGFMLEKRNNNIHQAYIPLVYRLRQGGYKLTGSEIAKGVSIPVEWSKISAYFPEDRQTKVVELCKLFLSNLGAFVKEAHTQFP